MIATVTGIEVLEPYRLRLTFGDGVSGVVDISELVSLQGVFEPLKDPRVFEQVRLDEELGTIAWPNDADIDPWVLHEKALGRAI